MWLLLTNKYLYLTENGRKRYVDRVEIRDEMIESFPTFWFSSKLQRPTKHIIDLDGREIDQFSPIEKLRIFEVPINRRLYEQLKISRSLGDLLKVFLENNRRFSDEFNTWRYKVPEVTDTIEFKILQFNLTGKNIESITDLSLPNLNIPDDQPSYSFSSIFLTEVWKKELTIRPFLEYSVDTKDAKVELVFQDKPNLGSGFDTRPIKLGVLEESLNPKQYDSSLTLRKNLDKWKIPVIIRGDLPDELENFEEITNFTKLMQIIEFKFGGVWDWSGDTVYLNIDETLN